MHVLLQVSRMCYSKALRSGGQVEVVDVIVCAAGHGGDKYVSALNKRM